MSDQAPTRMLFMGDASLTDGFQLIGFETWPDPTTAELDQVLKQLVESKQNAFIIIDSALSRRNPVMLRQIREEGGRIVVTEVPPLNDPENCHCIVDTQIQALLGNPPESED
ncbi:MAG: V-type ATP synthase subunit F [Candidatus Sedimenticola sp. (ex Thyasira tokunagai)]